MFGIEVVWEERDILCPVHYSRQPYDFRVNYAEISERSKMHTQCAHFRTCILDER